MLSMIKVLARRVLQFVLPGEQAGMDDHARGKERNRRALLTGGVASIARVVRVGASLITIPLTLEYLGNERFGLWMTISSVMAMAQFADFGIGNGVLNAVAKAFGKDDTEGVREAVSSGFAILGLIAVSLMGSFFLIFRLVNWGNFFRVVSPQARLEAGPALAVFATCFALNIAIDVVQRVQLGLQQGYRYSAWQLCGSTLGLIGVLIGIWLRVSLPVLVLAIAGAPVFATFLNAIHFFGVLRPDLRPSLHLVCKAAVSQIARLGGLFFVLQIAVAVSFSADNFIIARMLGAVSVANYAVPQRMFALITMMSGMLVAPLWPAYGEAVSRGDISWAKHTLRKSLLIVLGSTSAASFFLLIFSHKLLHIWVGSRVHPPLLLLVGLAIWTVIGCCGDALSMFMNGVEVIKLQVIVASIFGFGCLIAKIGFIWHFGISGVPWATVATYILLVVLPYSFYVPRIIRSLQATIKRQDAVPSVLEA